MDPDTICNICGQTLECDSLIVDKVGARGIISLIKKSKEVNDGKWEVWSTSGNVRLHNACRKWYLTATVKRAAEGAPILKTLSTSDTSLSETDPSENEFNFHDLCFICAKPWDRVHKKGCVIQHDRMRKKLLDIAEHRDDPTSRDLKNRLKDVRSLIAVGARYHERCLRQFQVIRTDKSACTPREAEINAAFQPIVDHIKEAHKGKYTVNELLQLTDNRYLSKRVLCRKLMEFFGDDIRIMHQLGRESLVLFKEFSMNKLCGDWYRDPNSLSERQQEEIVNVAAEIVRKNIENHNNENDSYQPPGQFLHSVQQDIPPLLRALIDKLIAPKSLKNVDDDEERYFVQRNVIAHSILALVRRSGFISHLQLALGIYIHRRCGSRLIIDVLNKLGFCVSYYQLKQYETSVIMDPPKIVVEDNVCVQHVFDRTEHTVVTLEGYNTYHCLGGIAIYTPKEQIIYEGRTKKLKITTKIPAATILSKSKVRIIPWKSPLNGLENIKCDDTRKLFSIDSPALPATYSTYLWAKHCNIQNVPSWKGFMEVLMADHITYNVSKVVFLPFINQSPSNMSTINTALHTARAETRRLNQKTCFVTFNEPLYSKARAIVAASQDTLQDVVVRLGGFHLLMSYLGSIGHIMNGSGLEDIWAIAYTPASVKKMLTGHLYDRAIRAHILTFTLLGIMICREMENEKRQKYDEDVKAFLQSWDTEPPAIGDCQAEPSISMMTVDLIAQLAILKNRGPTAQLWVQYFECVVIALQYIEAERSGNWNLHLQSIRKMLPIFHAAGHFNYAKSAQIYLQDMVNLELTMTHDEYRRFTTEGNFTVRRSDKNWCGVWTDMTIEQTLKRFFSTDLKHRSSSSSDIAKFISMMPSSFSIIECLEEYCGMGLSTSEQLVDLANNRTKRDDEMIKKFIFWFDVHRPFETRASLYSLSTRIDSMITTDCHLSFEKGNKSLESMVGKSVDKVSLSAVTSKVRNLKAVLMNDDTCLIDSALLFQRIALLFHGDEVQTRKAFEFELSPYPLSLFDEFGLMRKTSKSELYKIFKPYVLQGQTSVRNMMFVIDGGFLLNNVCWPQGTSFQVVYELYYSHIISKYGENSWVVFDGYTDEYIGIKSYERYRRRKQNMASDIEFDESTLITLSQKKFLSNVKNKMKLVQMLSEYLRTRGLNVKVAQEDAIALIARTAIELKQSTGREVAVVGNDIDLLVLLIGLSDSSPLNFYNITPGGKTNTLYSTEDHAHLKPYILFAHAFAGCDTTSAIYGKGKKNVISILQKNDRLQTAVKTFYNATSTLESLCKCAERIIAHLYSFKNPKQSLSDARYKQFASLSEHINLETRLASLPPTQPVLREHVKRTFYQVQSWLGNKLDALDWGWKRTTTMMIPVMNTKASAPDILLEMVQCSCTGDSTELSKYCGGQSCSNFSNSTVENTAAISTEERYEDDEDIPTKEFLDFSEGLDPEEFDIEELDENEQEDDVEIEYPF